MNTDSTIDVEFHPSGKMAIRRITKDTTFENVGDFNYSPISHENFVKGMSTLWDFRNASLKSFTGISTQAVIELAKTSRESRLEQRGDGGLAIVLKSKFGTGMANMFGGFYKTPNMSILVTSNYEEAIEWCCENHAMEIKA